MPRYSEDLREQAVKYVEAGNSYKSASGIFGATAEAISNWHRRYLKLRAFK
jgi:transposase-like protein